MKNNKTTQQSDEVLILQIEESEPEEIEPLGLEQFWTDRYADETGEHYPEEA